MLALHLGKHERLGDAVEHVGGGSAAPALFEPGVPGGADIGALRHLLAPEPGGAAAGQRQAEDGGVELGPAGLEEGAEEIVGVADHRRPC